MKTVVNAVFIVTIIFLLARFTKLPEYFDSYVYGDDFHWDAWLALVAYRFGMYFTYPFLVTFVEHFISSRRLVPFIQRLLENFNVHFFTYTIISALCVLFGVDKILGTDIFSSSDSFMFIGSFVFTLLLNKSIPNLLYSPNSKEDDSGQNENQKETSISKYFHWMFLNTNSRS